MQIVPTKPVPNQAITVQLSEQNVQINLYQQPRGLFMDLFVANAPIVIGVICENLNAIVRNEYLGFIGELAFLDQQGTSDPTYLGLGTRYALAYLPPS